MGRLWLVVLGTMLSSTRLPAQSPNPGRDRASGAFYAGLGATIVPIAAGVALMASGNGDFEHGPATAGFLLATGGLLLGPAVGDWAGGLGGRGFARFGLRAVAWLGGAVAGAAISWNNPDQGGVADAIILGGLGIASGLAVWDLATLKGGVRNHYAKSVAVMPVVRPDTGALGVAVHLPF